MFFVANRTHSICPRISIEATSCTTQHGPWGLVSLLSHSFLPAWAAVQESGLRATPARSGRVEPRPADELARRPGVAAAGGKQVGASGGGGAAAAAAAGYFFVPAAAPSVAWTRRGSGSGRRGARGGQRRRRREDRRPPRLTLLGALARRRLTPPPAAGKAESEGERGARSEGWAPRGPADGALRRFCYR